MKDVLVFEFSNDKHTFWIGVKNNEHAEPFFLKHCCDSFFDQKYKMSLITSEKHLRDPFIRDRSGRKISLLDCIVRQNLFPCVLAYREG